MNTRNTTLRIFSTVLLLASVLLLLTIGWPAPVVVSAQQSSPESMALFDPSSKEEAWFGFAVAVDSGMIFIGAPGPPTGENSTVIGFDAASQFFPFPSWSFFNADGPSLGVSVAIHEDLALAGELFGNDLVGAARLFDAETGELINVFVNPTADPGDRFGWKVALSSFPLFGGSSIVIGADGADTFEENAGVAYFFDSEISVPMFRFKVSDPEANDLFGRAKAMVGDNIVI